MHSGFIIKHVVAAAVAFFIVSAIGIVVANSAAERAWSVTHEALAKPFRSATRKTEFQLSDHQELRKIFLTK